MDQGSCLICELACAIQEDGHVRTHVLDHLKAPQGPVELVPVNHVLHRHIKDGLGAAHHLGTLQDRGLFQDLLHHRPPLAGVPQNEVRAHTHGIEPDFTLFVLTKGEQRGELNSGRTPFHQEKTDALIRSARGRSRRHDEWFRYLCIGNKKLGSAQGICALFENS